MLAAEKGAAAKLGASTIYIGIYGNVQLYPVEIRCFATAQTGKVMETRIGFRRQRLTGSYREPAYLRFRRSHFLHGCLSRWAWTDPN